MSEEDAFLAHFKSQFPRELGAMYPRRGKKAFRRNVFISSLSPLFEFLKQYRRIDCHASVYSFHTPPSERRPLIDTIFIDIDAPSLKIALKEERKLVDFLSSCSFSHRIYFSGAKGFHTYLDFSPIEVDRNVLKQFVERLSRYLKLQCIDMQVVGDFSRLSRLPFTFNSKTLYPCVPIPDEEFRRIEWWNLPSTVKRLYVERPPIVIEENRDLSSFLLKMQEEKKEKKQESSQKPRKRERKSKKRKRDKIPLEEALEIYRANLDIVKEKDNYIIAHCPFHPPDNHPSFVVFKDGKLAGKFRDYHARIYGDREWGDIHDFMRKLNEQRR